MQYTEHNSPHSRENTRVERKDKIGASPPPKQPGFLSEIFKFAILAIVIIVPVRLYVAQPFIVSGASMEPTFETGQYLIIDQLSYNFEAPHRGEVIIFRYPKDPSKFFIKRVIGLPNETVELRGKDVIIKNPAHTSGLILNEPYLENDNRESLDMSVTLESSEYFVMGDNRKASSDSRIWGPLPENLIVGRAFLRLFPLQESALLPGNYYEPGE